MRNIAFTIPNLIQGVSLQPDAQRDPSQGAIQINGVSSIAEGLRKRDSSRTLAKVSATPFGDAFFHTILRDQKEEYIAVITDTGIQVFDLAGNPINVVEDSGAYSYLSGITDARQQIRAVTIADYTWITNTTTATAMDPATAPVTSRPPHECLIWVKQAAYGNKYKVNINGFEVIVETPVAPVVSDGSTVTENRISSEEIAEQIITGLGTAGLTGYTLQQSGSVIWVWGTSPITVAATDAKANSTITAILGEVQAFTELPTIAPEGYQVEITGDPGTAFDNYYVEFEPRSGTFGEGAWAETVSPGVEYKVNPSTMPHVLIRTNSTPASFWFGPVNGQTVTGIPGGVPEWGKRTAGDYDTAPDPSFIGYAINDIFIYKNRLGFLADENVVLSRVREFFEFFPETVTTVLDSDPIDVIASNNRVSVLRYAVPYQDELILFSSQIQFRFNAAETVLTPATAQITVLTQFDVDIEVRPQQAGGGIFFMQSNGGLTDASLFQGKDSILSGPAGGVVGMVKTAEDAGFDRLIGFDMGGTSTDVCHYAGSYERSFETEVVGVRMRAPMMDIHTVAAGGGSVLSFKDGRYQVGPESAGANPGPACYRRGGPLTVTDCNVILGKLNPDHFPAVFGPDANQPLDVDAVRQKFSELAAEV